MIDKDIKAMTEDTERIYYKIKEFLGGEGVMAGLLALKIIERQTYMEMEEAKLIKSKVDKWSLQFINIVNKEKQKKGSI